MRGEIGLHGRDADVAVQIGLRVCLMPCGAPLVAATDPHVSTARGRDVWFNGKTCALAQALTHDLRAFDLVGRHWRKVDVVEQLIAFFVTKSEIKNFAK